MVLLMAHNKRMHKMDNESRKKAYVKGTTTTIRPTDNMQDIKVLVVSNTNYNDVQQQQWVEEEQVVQASPTPTTTNSTTRQGKADTKKPITCTYPTCDLTYTVRFSMIRHYKKKHIGTDTICSSDITVVVGEEGEARRTMINRAEYHKWV